MTRILRRSLSGPRKKKTLLAALAACCLTLMTAFGLLIGASSASAANYAGYNKAAPNANYAGYNKATPDANYAATTEQTFLTFYGWWDNTPPGGAISYPQIHQTAGGTGTYADPITFATDSSEQPPGTIVWVPRVGKYFIMEDSCQECSADWTGQGPNGGPGLRHLDLWLGGKGGSPFKAIECEDALTHYNADNTPTMEPVIVNPPSNETVDPTPIFNTSTGACYGGATPTITVGQYKNTSTGQCMNDPGNSSTSGVLLVTAACNGSAASQQFSFDGTFLMINNLCADYSTKQISMKTCTAGPSQQWSYNTDFTFTDIQSGQKYIVASSGKVTTGTSSGADKWTFIPASAPSNDFSVAVSPASGSVTQGGSATASVSTAVTSGSAESVSLTASGAPSGATVSFNPASVTSGSSSTVTIATASSTPTGSYPITITGTAASGTHTATYTLTVTSSTGGGCTPAQLLGNPGFENGTNVAPWTQSSTLGFDPITNASGEAPHSGTWKAWFNGNGSADTDTIAQSVTIPSGCTATLSYWLHIDTTENTTTATPDTFKVQVLNSSGTVLATLATYSNLNAATGYTQHSSDLSAYAGQTITLKFTGTETDKNGGTTAFVNDDNAIQTQ